VAMVTGLLMALSLLIAAVLPSSLLSYFMVKWLQLHQHALGVRAFRAGMVPLVMGLMLSAGWLLQTASNPQMDWRLLLMFAADMRSQYVDCVVHPRSPVVADVGWCCAGCDFGLVR